MREFFCLGWDLTMSEVFEVTGGIVPQDCWEELLPDSAAHAFHVELLFGATAT